MILSILGMVLVIVTLIFFNALYVAGEFAAVSARKIRIEQYVQDGNRLAKRLMPVIEDSHKLDNYIAASQVGITISSIVLGIYGQQQIAPLIVPLLSDFSFIAEAAAAGLSATFVLLLLTTLQVILGELVPKSVAIQYPERLAMLTVVPMRISSDIILKPLIIILNGSGVLLMKVLGIRHEGGHAHIHSPEEIQYLIDESHEGGLLDVEEHTLLDNAFRFSELRVGDIVVPRPKMVAAAVDTPISELLTRAAQADYTRIPLYKDDIDHIVGFVHLKELFKLHYQDANASIEPIIREPVFVTSTNRVDEVWTALDNEDSSLAIVIDEYGGTQGMVTREDLLEEIFGEVDDEFDTVTLPAIEKVGKRRYRLRGDAPLTLVNARLHLSLPIGRARTIGGLIVAESGHLPQEGDKVTIDNVHLTVEGVTHKAVDDVILSIPKKDTPQT